MNYSIDSIIKNESKVTKYWRGVQMKIYSQGDQAIVVAIEKYLKSLTEDLLTLRSYLIEQNYPFIIEIVPSESDMMIVYDARDMIKHHNIQSPFYTWKH